VSNESQTVTVNILDKDYQIACPPGEEAALRESAHYLDQQMRTIRTSGNVIGLERIAVMAGLNITHEMLQSSHEVDSSDHVIQNQTRKLSDKIDKALMKFSQMEL